MSIVINCPCGQKMRVQDEHQGKRIRCPGCQRELRVSSARPDIFVSYSNKDKPTADALCATLESHGLRCWIAPRDILPGADWGGSIVEAIEKSRAMVLIFSANSNESPQVKREVERAVAKSVAIIPFRIEDVVPSKTMEYFISAHHWLDALTPPLEDHLNTLADRLQRLLGDGQGARPPAPAAPPAVISPPPRTSLALWIGAGIAAAILVVVFLLVQLGVFSGSPSPETLAEAKKPDANNKINPDQKKPEPNEKKVTPEEKSSPKPPPMKPFVSSTPVPSITSIAGPIYTNALGMKFAPIPKGKGWLGDRFRMREYEVPQDFYLGVYEVTQEEWENVMGKNPSIFSRSGLRRDTVKNIPDAELKRFPVDSVSWNDCQLFVNRLNEQLQEAGWRYRLPTEAQWEYACRGGPGQDRKDYNYDYYAPGPVAKMPPDTANFGDRLRRPCPVGSYPPNRLGLYDMHGNIAEWCDSPADSKNKRVNRGGSYWEHAGYLVVSWQSRWDGARGQSHVGLRVARVPVEMKAQ